ncbi:Tetratricopeptide repeat-containing protein [Paucidesulfovibrio gracilis DSM 16080]|uniref:Tetratricopeptide repeat-containing protein n=1 Tax=Paucidesulfovibrio gracilis DSM 16080 TaxID=1121449 RepID=A0A1T4WB82_9BACT|nr:tetratricopeptide repeat protein [Paucidesulfovibrio gracilis]SKA74533.1 Tetratricopeptide repeat-containing protein [Paucidesulfovibrio gracilis DSM 16080]
MLRLPLLPFFFCLIVVTACTPQVRGSMALSRGNAQEAVALYRQALQNDPDSARIRLQLGKALLHAGEYGKASTRLQEALAALPDSVPDNAEARFYLLLTGLGKDDPQLVLARLMDFRPPGAEKLGQTIRLAATRASVRGLTVEETLTRMETAYREGRLAQRHEDDTSFFDLDD